jgi:hypothetical protein
LTGGAKASATLHQAPKPLLTPLQVHEVAVPLSLTPEAVPAVQVPAFAAQTPLIGGSAALQETPAPAPAPLHVHTEVLPSSFFPIA